MTSTEQSLAAQVIRQLSTIPPWLAAALDAGQVIQALNRHVPEFASGALLLRACAIDQLHLKGTSGEWGRNWTLTVAGAAGEQSIPMRVQLVAPELATTNPPTESPPFESSDWRCWLPEVGLLCKRGRSKKDKELPALKVLSDPEQACSLLEQALRTQAAGYEHISLRSCTAQVLLNKPGKSAIIRYTLAYRGAGEGVHQLRNSVIMKLYNDDIGARAFAGMRAIWNARKGASASASIPEPLAYLADKQALLMGSVPEERDIEKLLHALLLSDDPADLRVLHETVRATGAALADFHSSGAKVEQITTWDQGFAEAAEQLSYLRIPFPDAIAALDDLVKRLRALEAAIAPDALVPSHGAFRPEQILLAGKQISFIDFDYCCMAEPACDLALFRATMMDNGLYDEHIRPQNDAEAAARRSRIDALNESFLAGYEARASVSRKRVALWEAIFYLNDSLQCWTKPRPNDARLVVGLLERHLGELGIIEGPRSESRAA